MLARAHCPLGWLCQDPDLFRESASDGVCDVDWLSARPGARWYAVETVAGVTLGDEVELRHGDVAVDGDAALFERGCNWLNAMTWRAEDDVVHDQMSLGGLGCWNGSVHAWRCWWKYTVNRVDRELDSGSILEGAPMCEEVILLGLNTYAMRRCHGRGRHPERSAQVVRPLLRE